MLTALAGAGSAAGVSRGGLEGAPTGLEALRSRPGRSATVHVRADGRVTLSTTAVSRAGHCGPHLDEVSRLLAAATVQAEVTRIDDER